MLQKDLEALKIAFYEALKAGIRSFVFYVIPAVVVVILPGINTATGVIAINWAVAYAVGLTTSLGIILEMIDKAKHTYGKETNPNAEGKSFGLVKL